MTREEILKEALQCVNGEREQQKMNRVLNFARELMGGELHG